MIRYALTAILLATPATAQDVTPAPAISVELNALDAVDGACRLVFVARNGLEADVSSLILEAVAFDADGGVAQISLFDFADLPAGLPRVRQFDLPGLSCNAIGSLLVNGVQSCDAGGADCAGSLTVSSRTDVELLG